MGPPWLHAFRRCVPFRAALRGAREKAPTRPSGFARGESPGVGKAAGHLDMDAPHGSSFWQAKRPNGWEPLLGLPVNQPQSSTHKERHTHGVCSVMSSGMLFIGEIKQFRVRLQKGSLLLDSQEPYGRPTTA